RLPPRPTLSPYTSLFRAAIATGAVTAFATGVALASRLMGPPHNQTQPRMRLQLALQTTLVVLFAGLWALVHGKPPTPISLLLLRSEEHTSELQSRFDLVC